MNDPIHNIEQRDMSPTGLPGADEEKIIWTGTPLVRTLIPLWIITGSAAVWLSGFSVPAVDLIVSMTARFDIWTEQRVATFDIIMPILISLVLISPALIWTLERLVTKYELTTQRLVIHWGIIIRRHDEIALHRIRDYRTRRNVYDMIFRCGGVKIASRDTYHGLYIIGPIGRPVDLMNMIRGAALEHKNKMGYREYEGFNRDV